MIQAVNGREAVYENMVLKKAASVHWPLENVFNSDMYSFLNKKCSHMFCTEMIGSFIIQKIIHIAVGKLLCVVSGLI